MHALRVISFALGSWLIVAPISAEPESRPSIFADGPWRSMPASKKLEIAMPARPRLALSSEVRAALTTRINAMVASRPRPTTAAATSYDPSVWRGDAILMDRFIVNVPSEHVVKPERDPNPIYHTFSSGDLWLHSKWRALPQLHWSLGNVLDRGDGIDRLPVAGAHSTSPRAEIRFVWPW